MGESDGEIAAAISDAAMEATKSSGERSLPATSGLPLTLGALSFSPRPSWATARYVPCAKTLP